VDVKFENVNKDEDTHILICTGLHFSFCFYIN